jgi:hypothetical protein
LSNCTETVSSFYGRLKPAEELLYRVELKVGCEGNFVVRSLVALHGVIVVFRQEKLTSLIMDTAAFRIWTVLCIIHSRIILLAVFSAL